MQLDKGVCITDTADTMYFEGISKKARLYRRAFHYIRPQLPRMYGAFFLSVLVSVTSGFATYSFLPVFQIVFGENLAEVFTASLGGWQVSVTRVFEWVAGDGERLARLVRLVLFIVLLSVVSSLIQFLINLIFITIHAHGAQRLRQHTFSHLTMLPLSFFNRMKTGALISRIDTDINWTISMVAKSIVDALQNLLLAITFLGLLLFTSWQLVLVVVPVVLVIGGLVMLLGGWTNRNRKIILAFHANMNAMVQEFLSGIKTIKGLAAEKFELERWERSIATWRKLEVVTSASKVLPARLSEMVAVCIAATVLIGGGVLVIRESLTVAELLLFFVILLRFQTPVGALASLWVEIQDAMAYAERAFELISVPVEVQTGIAPPTHIQHGLRLQNITFSYGGEAVLKDITMDIPAGKITALVGPSGSGKSSIAHLLLRLYPFQQGRILLDETDVTHFELTAYRSLFGVVTQETFLFHDTVWNNLVHALPRAVSRAEVHAAVKAADADEFIKRLPQGYETVLGDRGVILSGGQRQRIAIARALLRQPAILVLDEATSSLDSKSEKEVQGAFDTLMSQRTALVIAHRLSTVQRADTIIVLNDGRVVERGRHSELIEHAGLYRHLWQLQFT